MKEQRILHLTIKKKWYDMILYGWKPEEYREIKKYWSKRLCESAKYIGVGKGLLPHDDGTHWSSFYPTSFKEFDVVQFYNGGYCSTKLPNFQIEYNGIEIREGNIEWGAEKGNNYFVIKLGKVLTK